MSSIPNAPSPSAEAASAGPTPARTRRRWPIILAALTLYLGLESLLPPRVQPTARVAVLAIDAYRAVVSPLLPTKCRFTPSCSQYGRACYLKYGTLRGTLKTFGRLARCSPLGPPPGEDLP